jgi:alginate O-acetyltransferase complex protein AlgJ
MTQRPPTRHRLPQRLFLVAALLLLALPGLLTLILPPRAVSELEARRLAAWPSPPDDLEALRAWPAAAEAWLQDHLGGRNQLLGAMARLRFLLREPGGTQVVFGRAGALFLARSARLELAAGQPVLDAPLRQAMTRVLELWAAAAATAGVPLLVVVVPDKETLHPDRLPWWGRRFNNEPRLDAFLAELAAAGRVEALDLRPALRAAAPGRATYLLEDTHWTDYGAYLGYRALIARLAADWPGLRALEGDAVAWRSQPSTQELRRMLGLPPSADAAIADQPVPAAPRARQLSPPGDLNRFVSELPGAPGPRLLLVGDSYRLALLPWLAESFPALTATGLVAPSGLAELLRDYPSDLVVIELVERNLTSGHVHRLAP